MTDSGETIPPIADAFFLTGPTAGGKTKIGVRLAKLIGAEVISLDSMAVYRMMDIGTAKPTESEREGVPHHLPGALRQAVGKFTAGDEAIHLGGELL